MTMFLLLYLLQQRRLSWAVIAAAAIVLIGGIALFVYFFRRYQKVVKETENDWESSTHSLFVDAAPTTARPEKASQPAGEIASPIPDKIIVQPSPTREFATDIAASPAASSEPIKSQPRVEPAQAPPPLVEPPRESRATEILASPIPKTTSAPGRPERE